jgi:hypothetical protein
MSYFEVDIVMTAKPIGSKEPYHMFDHKTMSFQTMAEVKKFLKDRYGKSKRQPMYVDKKAGGSEKVGYVFGFNNADWSHAPVEKWHQQDWVNIAELTPRSPFKKK